MKLNYDDDQRKPLKGGALNETKQDNETTMQQDESRDDGDQEVNDEKRRKYIKYGIFGGIGVIILVLAIVLPLTLGGNKPGPKPDPPVPPKPVIPSRQNPYYVVVDTEKNTAWSRSGMLEFDVNRTATVENLVTAETKRFLLGETSVEASKQIGVNWTASLMTGVNNEIKKSLRYTFDMIDFKIARFELTDADSDRFSIPDEYVNRPDTNQNMRLDMVGHFFRGTEKERNKPFNFRFFDNFKPSNLFVSTEDQSLIFSDKYIQMDFALPSNQVTGFGERLTSHRLGEGAWGMWASGTTDEDSQDSGRGRGGKYGVHPFLLIRSREAQKYIGMYFRNANAQLPIIRWDDQQKQNILSYITLGGQIEVYFFISGTAKEVVQDYQRIFGKPQLPPFWSLGWQEASQTVYNATYDKDNQLNLLRTAVNYRLKGLPLDAVYLDQKHMSNVSNFDVNPAFLQNATELKMVLNDLDIKLIAYIDSTIYAPDETALNETKNPSYSRGQDRSLFIKSSHFPSAKYSGNLVSSKGLHQCVYLDWFKTDQSYPYWFKELQQFHRIVDFDGVWTTNNEAYSDIQGEMDVDPKPKTQRYLKSSVGEYQFDTDWFSTFNQTKNSTYELPFIPEYKTKGPFDVNSISLNATHSDFVFFNTRTRQLDKRNETEYNLHSLYGHAMISTTYRALKDLANFNTSLFNKRPFVVTRSTFTGTNQYASYPIRYQYRSWTSLKQAIPHVMSMNMFGFTHTGVDACGSIDHPTSNRTELDEELCLRWIQLATFFPLARHSQNFKANDSYVTGPLGFKEGPRMEALKKTMRDRMQYLRFMYTCLFETSEYGGSCFDPVYFHHTLDVKAMEDATGTNDTFIFGGAVKVSPVLEHLPEGKTTFKSHFPKGRWLNLANMKVVEATTDSDVELDASQETVNVHLRPGSLIPMQDLMSNNLTINSTVQLLDLPITLVINRNERKAAFGKVFLDDGISKSELINKTYEYYTIDHKATNAIQFNLFQGKRGGQDDRHHIEKIMIGDAEDLQSTDFACAFTTMNEIINLKHEYNNDTKALKIFRDENFDTNRLQFSKIASVFYGNSKENLNLCSGLHYQYKLAPEVDLDKLLVNPSASMRLIHKGSVLPDLNLTVRMFDEGIINIRWTWMNISTNGKRAHPEIPDILVNTSRPTPEGQSVGRHVMIQADPFVIKVTVQQGQTEPLFEIDRFVYDSYFNWVAMTALSTYRDENHRGVMGLGERSSDSLFYKDGIYSMWAYDEMTKNDDGSLPGKNGYGVHPFFMYQHSADKWVGVFSKQAHAQDWIINNEPENGRTILKQISTGGISDFYVIINSNNPDSVIGYYQRIVGKPALMPQWSLGWHQCKYCLRSVSEYKEVVDNYAKNNIPLDAQWGDIDYMHNYQNFKVDYLYFGDLKEYVDYLYHNLTNGSVKFVPIVDAGIAVRQNYSTYVNGENQKVFLKSSNDGGQTLIAKVWPNDAAIPDFFAENATKWWHSELTEFRDNHVHFDGLWLDMNEAANFCKGACLERQKVNESMADMFYYTPTGRSLEYKSLPIDTVHANKMYTQLDTHNYFGAHQTAVTHSWFKAHSDKRPFIVGRSTFAGTGKYAGKWLGDSESTYEDMQRSVTGSMMMNMFGIPFVGGDICGFSGENSSPHLCTRWHQIGAFQPFSRNHRDCNGKPQEPYRFINDTLFNGTVSMTDLMRKSIYEKYSLIRYYYTHLFLLSQDSTTNGAFYKPVFFEFPNEADAYRANPSENIMLGPSLKLNIKTSPNKNWEVEQHPFYFPQGKWCDILNPAGDCINSTGSKSEVLDAGLKDYHLYLRDGHIIPFQNASALGISRSEDLQRHPVDLIINPRDMTKTSRTRIFGASGIYVNDNGTSTSQVGTYNKYSISFSYNDVVNGTKDDETIVIRVSVKELATHYYSNETRCAKINQNDVLGSIIIDDEFGMFQAPLYQVMILRPDGTYDLLGVANKNTHTNQMIYTGQDKPADTPEVCLGNIEEIIFRPPIA